jgi:hypothetical protein
MGSASDALVVSQIGDAKENQDETHQRGVDSEL